MRDAAVDVARVVLVYTSVLGAVFAAAVSAWLRWGATGSPRTPDVGLDGVPRVVAPGLFRQSAGPSDVVVSQRSRPADPSTVYASPR